MFFCRLAILLAAVISVFGILRIVVGLSIANELLGPYDVMLERYTTESSSGKVIDRGIYTVIFGIALGAVAEIGLALGKLRDR